MENNPNIFEFMKSEVQFFQEVLSEVSSEKVVMVDVSKPKSKSTKDFKPVKESARYDKEKIPIIINRLIQIILMIIINNMVC